MWFPTVERIVALHEQLLGWGGEPGVRHPGAVEAAVERKHWGPFEHGGDVFDRAAYLMRGIAQDPPFVDGNKRTAYFATDLFLKKNGWKLVVDAGDGIPFLLGVAQGRTQPTSGPGWRATLEKYKEA